MKNPIKTRKKSLVVDLSQEDYQKLQNVYIKAFDLKRTQSLSQRILIDSSKMNLKKPEMLKSLSSEPEERKAATGGG